MAVEILAQVTPVRVHRRFQCLREDFLHPPPTLPIAVLHTLQCQVQEASQGLPARENFQPAQECRWGVPRAADRGVAVDYAELS